MPKRKRNKKEHMDSDFSPGIVTRRMSLSMTGDDESLADIISREEHDLVREFKKRLSCKSKRKKRALVPDQTIAETNQDLSLNCPQLSRKCASNDELEKTLTTKNKSRFVPCDSSSDIHGVLFLERNQKVAVRGCMRLRIILGTVEMFGYESSETSELKVEIFSPSGSCLYYVKDSSVQPCSKNSRKVLEKSLVQLFGEAFPHELKQLLKQKNDLWSCVVVEKMNSVPSFLSLNEESYPPVPEFLSEPFDVAAFETDSWKDLLDELQDEEAQNPLSILVCGGKDVGKSSLSRYLINRLLTKHKSVFYLECDCGQTEFTPPAVLSLVKVTQPLLGPPTTHQQRPEKGFFYGNISPKDSPTEYIHIVESLFTIYCTDFSNQGPLIINQQGWVKGLGLSLLVDCLRITSPTFVIQINSTNFESRNIPEQLSQDYVRNQRGWFTDHQSSRNSGTKYLTLDGVCVAGDSVRVNKSSTSRNLLISTYFDRLRERECKSSKYLESRIPPLLSDIRPYKVPWDALAIHVMHQNVSFGVMLHAFNMAVVCLASVDKDLILPKDDESAGLPNRLRSAPTFAQYLGFGLVRNIDVRNRLFYILMPEPIEELGRVNALLKGNVHLPTKYLTQDPRSDHPYFCYDYINIHTKISSGMKTRYNIKRKPSRNKNSFGERSNT